MEKGAEVDCGNPKSHNQQDGPKESGAFGFLTMKKQMMAQDRKMPAKMAGEIQRLRSFKV